MEHAKRRPGDAEFVLKASGELRLSPGQSGGFTISSAGRSASIYGSDARKTQESRKVIRCEQLCTTLERDVCMDWRLVIQIGTEICLQVSRLHARGDAVLDLNLGNVVVEYRAGQTGTVRVLNSKIAAKGDALLSYKELDSFLRPELFRSPEQRQGKRAGAPSDVFSIASILYTCITGSPLDCKFVPYFVSAIQIQNNLRRFGVSDSVARAIARAFHPDPLSRFQTAGELRMALMNSNWEGEFRPARRPATPKRTVISALLVGVVSLVSYALGALPSVLEHSEKQRVARNTFPGSQTLYAPAASPTISFNKEAGEFKYGDKVAITIAPPRSANQMYLFYIDQTDKVMAIYPSRTELRASKNSISEPKTISKVGANAMFVNSEDGKFLLVSVNESGRFLSQQLLTESDWSDQFPLDHVLRISGADLMARLDHLQGEYPEKISTSLESAPKCAAPSLLTTQY